MNFVSRRIRYALRIYVADTPENIICTVPGVPGVVRFTAGTPGIKNSSVFGLVIVSMQATGCRT
jgi:hypothetical protein